MDIKAKIAELEAKIKGDPKLLENFGKEPVKTVEGIIGVDLPDDQINGVVEGLKAKLAAGDVANAVSGIAGKIKGLF
ncbi:MAG: hypothetical protein II021_00840 [Oscillospiraceae bacterium]|nr:hypothetical protein [Oscillospiraceae bacterium]MBQ2329494.1 hypothetical protein [Oscillospiraceae bacterium]